MPLVDTSVLALDDLALIEANPRERLIQIYMDDVTGLGMQSVEIVTFVSLPDDLVLSCNHPIAIWTDGSFLDRPRDGRRRAQSWGGRRGERAATFLRRLAELSPLYAAVTISERLPCPAGMQTGPTYVFRDFYLSQTLLSDVDVQGVLSDYRRAGAEVHPTPTGCVVFATGFMNEGKRHPAPEVVDLLSPQLGLAIAGRRA
jgi:hypothetical protein